MSKWKPREITWHVWYHYQGKRGTECEFGGLDSKPSVDSVRMPLSNCLQKYQATNPMGRGSCLEVHTDIQGMSIAWTHWNARSWCCVCVCVRACVCMYVFMRYIYRHTYIYMYIYVYMYIFVYIYTHVHIYMTSLVTQMVKLLPTI